MKYCYILLLSIFMISNLSSQCNSDRHTMNYADAWISCDPAPNPNPRIGETTHWIMYDLGSPHDLYNLHIWNYNHYENADYGLATFSISTSLDGLDWNPADTMSLDISDASAFYEGYTVTNLEGVTAQWVLITAVDNHGGDCYGLSEVKIDLNPPAPCENKIAMDLVLSPDIIGSAGDIVLVTLVVVNIGTEPLYNVNLIIDEKLFSGEPYSTTLSPSFQGDPNGNGILDIGEVWYYSAVKSYSYEQGDVFIISGAVTADADCGQVASGAGKLLYTVINNALMPHPELEIEYLTKLAQLENASDIYPNPASGGEVVNIPISISGSSELFIMDSKGKVVSKMDIVDYKGGELQFSTRDLSPGTYFITQPALSGITYKLIVQ